MNDLDAQASPYFPYPTIRPYQDQFIDTIREAIKVGKSVLVEGSNGLGKTIAALSACLPKAIEENFKILYVARTHRQHERVIEELKAISKRQAVSGISLRGRHEMCLNNLTVRHPLDTRAIMEICELLKTRGRCKYYRRIEERQHEYSDLQRQISIHPYTASELQTACRRTGFCPYELAKSALPDVRVIALSYLYVFDPVIRAAFLNNLETPLSRIILIVDEAHNLPETAVSVASGKLSLFVIGQSETEAKKFKYKDIATFAKTIRSEIEEKIVRMSKQELVSPDFLLKLVQEKAGVADPLDFFEHLHDTGILIKRSLLADGKFPRSYIHAMGYFMLKWHETANDQAYTNVVSRYVSREGVPSARLEIVALDPSKTTVPVFSSVYASVMMSGTLQPMEAYINITGLPEDTISSVLPSPFPKEHILPLINCGVTTAMEKRTPEMYRKITQRLKEIVANTPANTGIFTPSFEVLNALLATGLKNALNKPLYCEHRSMTSRENERMVAEFKEHSRQTGAVLLGVQGGRSSEGVDFPGDEMNSVAIVGLPYAEPTPKIKAQIDYFEERFSGFGREYGYVLPAMKKASQAAGRPIRTPDDRGAMIFLDRRFSSAYCRSFLPAWIRENLEIVQDEDGIIAGKLNRFFKRVC